MEKWLSTAWAPLLVTLQHVQSSAILMKTSMRLGHYTTIIATLGCKTWSSSSPTVDGSCISAKAREGAPPVRRTSPSPRCSALEPKMNQLDIYTPCYLRWRVILWQSSQRHPTRQRLEEVRIQGGLSLRRDLIKDNLSQGNLNVWMKTSDCVATQSCSWQGLKVPWRRPSEME